MCDGYQFGVCLARGGVRGGVGGGRWQRGGESERDGGGPTRMAPGKGGLGRCRRLAMLRRQEGEVQQEIPLTVGCIWGVSRRGGVAWRGAPRARGKRGSQLGAMGPASQPLCLHTLGSLAREPNGRVSPSRPAQVRVLFELARPTLPHLPPRQDLAYPVAVSCPCQCPGLAEQEFF